MTRMTLHEALGNKCFETARRLGMERLASSTQDEATTVFLLFDALLAQTDFSAATALLDQQADILEGKPFEEALCRLRLLRELGCEAHFRDSAEAHSGATIDEYLARYHMLAKEAQEYAISLARTDQERQQVEVAGRPKPHPPFSHPELPRSESLPEDGQGRVTGRIVLQDGAPASNVEVVLGLEVLVETPDPTDFVSHSMHFHPRIGPIRSRSATTDQDGSFKIENVPSGTHAFLAVRLDPDKWAVPTRFLTRDIVVTELDSTDLGTLVVKEWSSAPPQQVTSPHPPSLEKDGFRWSKQNEWKLSNPFHYAFPRQLLTLSTNTAEGPWLVRIDPERDETFQRLSTGEIALLTELPPLTDRFISLYRCEGARDISPPPTHPVRLNRQDSKRWILDTGVCQFTIPGSEAEAIVPPLLTVCGPDRILRGKGRFRLPEGVSILRRQTSILEEGPLLITIETSYTLSDGSLYSWRQTALAGEPLLLVEENSSELDGAAFEFSLAEFSGGRGFLHWKAESGSKHWQTLQAQDACLGRIPESVPWWISPQGFGYAMGPDGLKESDYIGVFSRRRGEWVDRAFEKITQGPIDENGDANWELDWPYPEMVGSTLSMITAETTANGDAFFRFAFFDGQRQWGLYVSSFEKNDGPWRHFGRIQHAYSSPRLQEVKDWNFDVADELPRPHLVAKRDKLPELRRKAHRESLASLWKKIKHEPVPGPRQGLTFAVEGDPLLAWQLRIRLCAIADVRSKMTLLGRDWADMYSPVGGREITILVEEYDLLAASGVFTAEEERRIRAFFILMAHMYMEEDFMNWRFNARNANFEADRTDIVGAIGLAFPGHPDSDKFCSHALERTRQALTAYCTPSSGKWYENPACYYLHALRCRMNLVFHLVNEGQLQLRDVPKLPEFLLWGVQLLTPAHPVAYSVMHHGEGEQFADSGKIRKVPPIGDHAGIGRWLPEHYFLLGKLFVEHDPVLAEELFAAYFCASGDGQRLLGNLPWEGGEPETSPHDVHTAATFGNLPLLFCHLEATDIPDRPKVNPVSRRLEGFGAVFRNHVNTERESYLLVKQGPGGYRYHRTEGSFLLFADQKPLIFDGGEAGETWRHSTLSFHDIHMPLSPGRVECYLDEAGVQFVQGVHPVILQPGQPSYLSDDCHHELVAEAYRRHRLNPPAVVRSFAWIDGDYLIVHDDLSSSLPELSHWHLQVVGGEPLEMAHGDYLFPGRFGTDLRVIFPGQGFSKTHTESLPVTYYMGEPSEWFTMQHFQVSQKRARNYLAAIRPMAPGEDASFEVEALPFNNVVSGLRVAHDRGQDWLFLGREDIDWWEEDMAFSGTYGAILKRTDSTRLVLMGPGQIEIRDLCLSCEAGSALLVVDERGVSLRAHDPDRVEVKMSGNSWREELTPATRQVIRLTH